MQLRNDVQLIRWPRLTTLLAERRLHPVVTQHELFFEQLLSGAATEIPQKPAVPFMSLDEKPCTHDWAALDTSYARTLPNEMNPFYLKLRNAVGVRQFFIANSTNWPTLPSSTFQQAQALATLPGKTAYIDNDVDGLGLILAQTMKVTVRQDESLLRHWFMQTAEALGVQDNIEFRATPPRDQLFDLSVGHAGALKSSTMLLKQLLATTKVGGHLALQIRYPWDKMVEALLEAHSLPITNYFRDCCTYMLPGGFVVDGGGDLVVVQRTDKSVPPDTKTVGAIGEPPYSNFDIDSLNPALLNAESMQQFFDFLTLAAPHIEYRYNLHKDGERDVLSFYDEKGFGLTAELRRDQGHMLLSFMPHHDSMFYAALSAAFCTLGDLQTRCRPLRTHVHKRELLFG